MVSLFRVVVPCEWMLNLLLLLLSGVMSQYSILFCPEKFDGKQGPEFSTGHLVKRKVWYADVDEETVVVYELTNSMELSSS
jgi:hypothetical protein